MNPTDSGDFCKCVGGFRTRERIVHWTQKVIANIARDACSIRTMSSPRVKLMSSLVFNPRFFSPCSCKLYRSLLSLFSFFALLLFPDSRHRTLFISFYTSHFSSLRRDAATRANAWSTYSRRAFNVWPDPLNRRWWTLIRFMAMSHPVPPIAIAILYKPNVGARKHRCVIWCLGLFVLVPQWLCVLQVCNISTIYTIHFLQVYTLQSLWLEWIICLQPCSLHRKKSMCTAVLAFCCSSLTL